MQSVFFCRQFLRQQLSESAVNLKAQQKSDDAADITWMAEQVKTWNKLVAVNRQVLATLWKYLKPASF